jgi:hypothetical protein
LNLIRIAKKRIFFGELTADLNGNVGSMVVVILCTHQKVTGFMVAVVAVKVRRLLNERTKNSLEGQRRT